MHTGIIILYLIPSLRMYFLIYIYFRYLQASDYCPQVFMTCITGFCDKLYQVFKAFPLPDTYTGSLALPQTFILKAATMFARMLEHFQHSTQLTPKTKLTQCLLVQNQHFLFLQTMYYTSKIQLTPQSRVIVCSASQEISEVPNLTSTFHCLGHLKEEVQVHGPI